MKSDSRTYSRAIAVSMVGAVLQAALGTVLLIYGLIGASAVVEVGKQPVLVQDHYAITGGIFTLMGIVVWVTLAIVFDQHRRERIEALENEALDQAGGRSTVFEAAVEDLRVQARRLAWMHRFMVPAIGIMLGGSLMAVAYVRYRTGLELISLDTGNKDAFSPYLQARGVLRGWAMSLGIGMAIIGFIFARFVSGMSKQPVWSLLRAGAAYAVSASLVGLGMVVAHFFDLAGTDVVLRAAVVVLPVLVGLLGAEILLSLLLNLYRPRKAGDQPRAAFDSPVLSFVASPDRIAKTIGDAISYQFGVDVTGSWAYRLLSRSVVALAFFGGLVVWLLTVVSVVGPEERGLRVRYGALLGEVGPGLHFKLPWPLESIDKQNIGLAGGADGTPGIELATNAPKPETRLILWTNDHKVEEFPFIIRAGASATDEDATDLALMIVEVPMVYRVSDVEKWDRLAAPAAREDLIRARARREILKVLATYSEDELVGPGRSRATAQLASAISAAMSMPADKGGLDAGITIEFVGISGLHPPKDAALKYEEVVSSQQQREYIIEGGRINQIELLTAAAGDVETARSIAKEIDALVQLRDAKKGEVAILAQEQKIEQLIVGAGGKAAELLSSARSMRWTRHMAERGRAEGYNSRLAAYRANPKLYLAGLYLNAVQEIMLDARVYIVSDETTGGRVTVDLKDLDSGGNVLTGASSQPR